MAEPLNPELFARLKDRYGRVLIANEGEAMQPAITHTAGGRKRVLLNQEGEMYRICCPICARNATPDSRFRLYINHRWGAGHERVVGDKFWWAIHCFNEQCMCDPANRKLFRDEVFNDIGRDIKHSFIITEGDINEGPLTVKQLPGDCCPLVALPETHPAKMFLRSRGYDPDIVGVMYDLYYCLNIPAMQRKLSIVQDRIIAPFKTQGELVGWQARFVGNAVTRRTPKYFTCPGMRTGRVLYDFDRARLSPVVFICEGITDVWSIGPGAVAIMGKNFSATHFELVCNNWRVAVVLLDPDAERESGDIYDRLSQRMRVVRVLLPQQTDPASLARDFLFEQIYIAGRQAGYDLADVLNGTAVI